MLPILQIGPLAVQTPGLALLLGIWLGIALAEKHAAQHGVAASKLYNLVFTALIAGLIGARLVYALRFPAEFIASPLSLFSLNPGLLDAAGGLGIALLAAIIYTQRSKIEPWAMLDALTPALAVFMLALGAMHFAAGTAFGAPADLPWSVDLWGETRHPSQVYEMLAAALILALLWPGRERLPAVLPGDHFLNLVALSAAARLLLEAWRGDSLLLPGGVRLAQVVAWLVLAGCTWLWRKRHTVFRKNSQDVQDSQG